MTRIRFSDVPLMFFPELRRDPQSTWNDMNYYDSLFECMMEHGEFCVTVPQRVRNLNLPLSVALNLVFPARFSPSIRVAEIGGTVAERFFGAMGLVAVSVDAGYRDPQDECRIRDEYRLVTLANWTGFFGTDPYDYTCSRLLFDSPGIDVMAEITKDDGRRVRWGAPLAAANEELLLLFANLTRVGGLSFHWAFPSKWYNPFLMSRGFSVYRPRASASDPIVLERIIPDPIPREPIAVGFKRVQYVQDERFPDGRWELCS